jgi:hypothetical protein
MSEMTPDPNISRQIFITHLENSKDNAPMAFVTMQNWFGGDFGKRLGIIGDADSQAAQAVRKSNAINAVHRVISFLAKDSTMSPDELWTWATTNNEHLYHGDDKRQPLTVLWAGINNNTIGWDGMKRVVYAAETDKLLKNDYEKSGEYRRIIGS